LGEGDALLEALLAAQRADAKGQGEEENDARNPSPLDGRMA
jgi:hypothetical protein